VTLVPYELKRLDTPFVLDLPGCGVTRGCDINARN
jgi:hypothetical protein